VRIADGARDDPLAAAARAKKREFTSPPHLVRVSPDWNLTDPDWNFTEIPIEFSLQADLVAYHARLDLLARVNFVDDDVTPCLASENSQLATQ
jgi:hypothetical protein